MKRIAVLLALMLVSVAGYAQDTTSKSKAEIKAQRKAEKVEQKRVQDSIFQAQQAEYARIRREREMKEGATALVAKTPFESKKEILDLLVHSMITNGITPASIDKDYYIIRTGKRSAGSATYETTYTIFLDGGKVCVRAASIAEGRLGMSFGFANNERTIVMPIEYNSNAVRGSAVEKAWREMEAFLLALPYSNVQYIKGE